VQQKAGTTIDRNSTGGSQPAARLNMSCAESSCTRGRNTPLPGKF
jgi:hypothetical protein